MKIYDFLAGGNTVEIQYGKHLTKYATFSNGALCWAKNTDTLNGLLINSLQERQDKLNKTFTDVYPDDFIIGNVIVCLYDSHNKCLLHNKTLDEAENFIKNYNPDKQRKEDNNMTINDFLAQSGSIECTWNADIKCRKIVTANDFNVSKDIALDDLTNFLWQNGRFESNGTSTSVKLQNKQYTLIDANGNILIEKVEKSEAADFLKHYTPELFKSQLTKFKNSGESSLVKIIENLNTEFNADPEKRKLILKAYTTGIKFKYDRDTIFYDLRTITERYNKITAENSITTQDEQRKVLSNIVDFYCDII